MKKAPILINKKMINAPFDLCIYAGNDKDKKVHIHQIILMCISPYFQKLIQYKKNSNINCNCMTIPNISNLNDSNTTDNVITLNLKEISYDILLLIINYAYSDSIKIDFDNIQELTIISDMYNILSLFKLCIKFLIFNLNIQNCINIYLFSHTFKCEILKEKSSQFILHNFSNLIQNSIEFQELLDETYLNDLLKQNHLYVEEEYIVFLSILKWIDFDETNRSKHFEMLFQNVRLALISSNELNNLILKHDFVEKNDKLKNTVIEILKLKKYLQTWGKPNQQMLNKTISKFFITRFPKDIILVFGGKTLDMNFVFPEKLVEAYDHRAERWKQINFLEDENNSRNHHQVLVVDNEIYLLGGKSSSHKVLNSCRKFNLFNKKWKEISPMNDKRAYFSSVVLDNQIYAIGGFNGIWRLDTVEKYDINLNQWQIVASMHHKRSGAGASILDGKIFVVGGYGTSTFLGSAEFYSPKTNEWTLIRPMLKPRNSVSLVTLDDNLYAIGGLMSINVLLSSVEKYDFKNNKWTMLDEEMIVKKCSSTAIVLDGKIFVIGGWNGIIGLNTIEVWCSKSKRWYLGTKMIKRRTGCSACVVYNVQDIENYTITNRENLIDERLKNVWETENYN